jgi:CHASE3 domain.
MIENSEQKTRLDKMLELCNEYYDSSNEIVRLLQQNKTAEALAIFNTGKQTKFVDDFVKLNQQFRDLEVKSIKQATQKNEGIFSFLDIGVGNWFRV